MADDRSDPLADLFTLFASPLSGTMRSIEQFRKGVDEFLRGVENFNRAMENLNETTERINSLVAEVEQPLRAAIPQVTRTVKAADEMMQVVSGPAMAVAPGLHRLAETLSTPAFAQLPNQIGAFSDVLGEVSRRLGPLTQLAESAGGLFGGFRIPGSRPSPVAPPPEPEAPRPDVTREVATTSPARQATAKKAPAKKRAAKKAPAKKAPAKKRAAKKHAAEEDRPPRSRRPRSPPPRSRPPSGSRRQRRTNGVAATAPGRSLPRTSIVTRPAPSGVSGGANPRATPWPSTGEKLPLVTSPTTLPSMLIAHPARAGRRPSVSMPTRRRAIAALTLGERCVTPDEGRLVPGDHPAEACLERRDTGTEFVAVQRQGTLESQRVAGAEARRWDPGVGERPPQLGGRLDRHGDLDAVLAGVAGAGDGAGHALPVERCHPEPTDRTCGGKRRGHQRLGVGALHGDDRTLGRGVRSPDGGTHAVGVRGVRHDVERIGVVGAPPHDDVVDHGQRQRRRGGARTGRARARSWSGRW